MNNTWISNITQVSSPKSNGKALWINTSEVNKEQ